jgi:hypothetical protein
LLPRYNNFSACHSQLTGGGTNITFKKTNKPKRRDGTFKNGNSTGRLHFGIWATSATLESSRLHKLAPTGARSINFFYKRRNSTSKNWTPPGTCRARKALLFYLYVYYIHKKITSAAELCRRRRPGGQIIIMKERAQKGRLNNLKTCVRHVV